MSSRLSRTALPCSSSTTTTTATTTTTPRLRLIAPQRRGASARLRAAPLSCDRTPGTVSISSASERPLLAPTAHPLLDRGTPAPPSSSSSPRPAEEPRRGWQAVARVAAACAASCAIAWSVGSGPSLANPYLESKKTILLGVTTEGTIRGCQGNVNPNCVSTASTNELYAPAWRANTRSAKEAAQELETLVQAVYPEWSLVQSQTYDYGEYRAFLAPSLFGKDILEFLIKDESVNNRNWEGDREGPFVTYRSLAGSVKYIWPIQQPLSDFGVQKTRLQELRGKLGWQVIGCELIECYEY